MTFEDFVLGRANKLLGLNLNPYSRQAILAICVNYCLSQREYGDTIISDTNTDDGGSGWITIKGTHVLTENGQAAEGAPSFAKTIDVSKSKSEESGSSESASGYETVTYAGVTLNQVDTKTFTDAVKEAQSQCDPLLAWRVSAPSQEDFEEEHPGTTCYVTDGGSTFAVDESGDIVSVCKTPNDTTVHGKDLMEAAVEAGGTKLDSYEGNHGFYTKCGFEPVSWCKWDDDYAPTDNGWDASRDNKEDIIFYTYTGKTSQYTDVEAFKNSVASSTDYDAAKKTRDDSMR